MEASCEASNVAFDFCAMIKGGKIARHASPASLKFDSSIQESLLELHAAAVKAHRNAQAPLGLVSTLLNRMGGTRRAGAGYLNDRRSLRFCPSCRWRPSFGNTLYTTTGATRLLPSWSRCSSALGSPPRPRSRARWRTTCSLARTPRGPIFPRTKTTLVIL